VNAKATKPEHRRVRPATVTARKHLEANSSRMVHHRSLCPCPEGTTVPLHSQRVSFSRFEFRRWVMFSSNSGSSQAKGRQDRRARAFIATGGVPLSAIRDHSHEGEQGE
jgi:hypothetical protein